jgi:RNA-directed DNA polymerase
MTKASISLQDLRRRLYVKAKAETSWRFWGLYVHVCKMETLRQAYALAKENDGAPGVDGVTFEAIEAQGVEAFLEQIRDELVQRTYKPLPARRREIPKGGGKIRVLSLHLTQIEFGKCERKPQPTSSTRGQSCRLW